MSHKTALVTGASNGIGFDLAQILAEQGYDLVLVARHQDKLEENKEFISQAFGVKVHVLACDLSKPGTCPYVYEQTRKNGWQIDILVNNAGIGDWGYFVDSSLEKQSQLLHINILALTELTRLFLPAMVKRRQGRVMNVASTAAFQPGPLMAVYYASKAFVLSLSLAIAEELRGTNVTVTCLCPGPTATGFQAKTFPGQIRLTREQTLPSSKQMAQYGFKAMMKGRILAVPGFMNNLIILSLRILPLWITLRLVHYMQSEEEGDHGSGIRSLR